MPATQENRFMALGTSLGDDAVLLNAVHGREALGEPFSYEVDVAAEKPETKPDDLLGTNVTIRIQADKEETRYINGFVSKVIQISHKAALNEARLVVVPWLWFLTRTSDCRIFQEMTVPDIIQQVFRDYGFTDFEDRLLGKYRTWEYCVQYRESAFDFVSRLMEQEGIYYYFKHEDGKHTLVLADDPGSHDPIAGESTIPYLLEADAPLKERFYAWSSSKQVQSGTVAIRDFNFLNPQQPIDALSSMPREHEAADFEVFDYPGEFAAAEEGDSYARVRAEELSCRHHIISGRCDARLMATGGLFTLEDPSAALRDDVPGEYLVVQTSLSGVEGGYRSGTQSDEPYFECTVRAIPSGTPYRSARVTPKPAIQGPQTAIVVGKDGEEIDADEHGRVKVQFHWDRDGKGNETSSCWVRVSQPLAGKGWGHLYTPRIGQEVIVEFLEGDPDRPIITGRVYNAVNKPPYDPKSMPTISGIKTNTSKGGGGFNEIRFEDKAGEEQIFIHGQKNYDQRILNDRFEWIGNDRHLIVKNDKFEHIENDRHEKVDTHHKEEIGKERHLKVGGKQAIEVGESHSLTVKGDVIEVFKANHSEETTGDVYVKGKNVVIEAQMGLTIKCGSNAVVVDPKGVTITGSMVVIDGKLVNINSGPGSPAGSGKAGKAVAPTAPDEALEADVADPGEVEEIKREQREMKKGKYGAVPVPPFKPSDDEDEDKETSWIEIELVGEDDEPIPGQKYEVTLPDGTVASGSTDQNGYARVEGFDPGSCKVSFPDLDEEAWEKI